MAVSAEHACTRRYRIFHAVSVEHCGPYVMSVCMCIGPTDDMLLAGWSSGRAGRRDNGRDNCRRRRRRSGPEPDAAAVD